MALVAQQQQDSLALSATQGTITRKSGLLGPTMLLEGHDGEVFTCAFSPGGKYIASGGMDKNILVWNVYGECENWCMLKGHSNAVLDIKWSQDMGGTSGDSTRLYSCSADKSVAVWDIEEGKRIKKLSGHEAIVNTLDCARRGDPLLVSGGDDGAVKLWDLRMRRNVCTFEHGYQILSVAFDDTAERVFAGTLDNQIMVLDMRRGSSEGVALDPLVPEHADSVTSLALSHDGAYLLSNGMDQVVRLWDVRPHCVDGRRLLWEFQGASHSFEKNLLGLAWSHDDCYFSAGSADRMVNVWDVRSRELAWRLPGHSGSVNGVAFHPKETYVIASASSDGKIYMGELN